MNKNNRPSFEVTTGENLAALLKNFPGADVKRLVSNPGEDTWKVTVDPEADQVTGPTRVVCVVEDGNVAYGTTPSQAFKVYGVRSEVMFIRDDGWTLGATYKHRDAAFKLWEGDWIAEVDMATKAVTPLVNVGPVPVVKAPEVCCPKCEWAGDKSSLVSSGLCPKCGAGCFGMSLDESVSGFKVVKTKVWLARLQATPNGRKWVVWDAHGHVVRSTHSKPRTMADFWKTSNLSPGDCDVIRYKGVCTPSELAAAMAEDQED